MTQPTPPQPWHNTMFHQRPDETVLLILRRHWIVLTTYIFRLIVLNLIPIVGLTILNYFTPVTAYLAHPIYVAGIISIAIYYLIIWVLYFYAFIDYHLDIWIITDQRIIDVQQRSLFDRLVSELNITKVQDATSEVRGPLQTLLNYGNVYVQTAGEEHRFVFQQVPHAEKVAELVIQTNEAATKQLQTPTANAPVHP